MKLLQRTQWLAEDELGLARILPFVYGHFFLNLADKTKNYNTTSKTLHALAQVLHSLYVMVCILMTPTDSSVKLIDVHVKILLRPFCEKLSREGNNTILEHESRGSSP